MSSRSWIIGSSSQCDIRVQSPTVSGTHCRLTEQGDSYLLEDLQSSNGVFVSGERITSPRVVRPADQVTLGKSVPLPWPLTITIGRLPDNNVVINLETISSHHARLEREGDRVYLVDLGSTNGTAINNPLKKITRAPLTPQDVVYLGTHRMQASALFAKLPPEPARLATALEQTRPAEFAPAAPLPGLTDSIAQAPTPPRKEPLSHSLGSWLGGLAISAALVAAIFGGNRYLRSPASSDSNAKEKTPESSVPASADASTKDAPPRKVEVVPAPATISTDIPAPPDEKVVRRAEAGVALLGLRIGEQLLFTKVSTTVWACGPREAICPTAMLEKLKGNLGANTASDESLVVCAPAGPIAIVDFRSGTADADSFSIVTLESSLGVACPTRAKAEEFRPLVGQKLAVLAGQSQNDDPRSITRLFALATIQRIDRATTDKLPQTILCTAEHTLTAAPGAPVFDAAGAVVGCVRSFDGKTNKLEVVPLFRLRSLVSSSQ